MTQDESLKKDFYNLFVENLTLIAKDYDKRKFKGVKQETAIIENIKIKEIEQSFKISLFGDGVSNDHSES